MSRRLASQAALSEGNRYQAALSRRLLALDPTVSFEFRAISPDTLVKKTK